jgi:hypothetical protein
MWMRFCPGERLFFGIKKAIDDDGVALSRSASERPRSFAIHYVPSSVYGHACRIRKNNFAAIGNFLWIDSAMRFLQPFTVPRRWLASPNLRRANKPSHAPGLNARWSRVGTRKATPVRLP